MGEEKDGVEMDEAQSSENASNGMSSPSVASTDSGVCAVHNKESAAHTLWSCSTHLYNHDWSLGLSIKFICLLRWDEIISSQSHHSHFVFVAHLRVHNRNKTKL